MKRVYLSFAACLFLCVAAYAADTKRPNIVLVMADDQGWGQTGYNGHPTLKTPHLDAMAAAGLRFNRFYAGAPVCSPTRAAVLTGRSPTRTGVPTHGQTLCLQEKTLPQALKRAGYSTAHFGKWHLNGVRGAGVPILGNDANHPGRYGFDEWLSVTNYFDLNPLMSRNGHFEELEGDSSVVIVREALKYMAGRKPGAAPFFTVIWYGSPHSPMHAEKEDRAGRADSTLGNHLGEIVGIDRSVGLLRKGLRDIGIEKNTLVWYCSDNGGLTTDPDSCGKLRGNKGSVYEGGLRVPGIIEWPGKIQPATTDFPACVMDMMPTFVELLDLPDDSMLFVRDGQSLLPLFNGTAPKQRQPMPFSFLGSHAWIDGNLKIVKAKPKKKNTPMTGWALYDLETDPGETTDLSKQRPQVFKEMVAQAEAAMQSIAASAAGADYPEGRVLQPARSQFWTAMKAYQPHFERFFQRPEYENWAKKVPAELK